MDFMSIFETLAALVAAVPVITQAIKKLAGELPSWANQLISWVVGIILVMFAWAFDLGCMANAEVWQALIVGVGVSLSANGVFDIKLIQWVLELIFGKIKSKE
jgi:hypothetical protein